MLNISEQALREGAERARDLFRLGRLSSHEDAEAVAQGLWSAFGIGPERLRELVGYLDDLMPISGLPEIEAPMSWGLAAGVLVGLLIADSAAPLDAFGDLPVVAP
jgi:hypothetical protein